MRPLIRADNHLAIALKPRVRLKRPLSFLLRHPNVNKGGIPVALEQDLAGERLGQARSTRDMAAHDAYIPCELLSSGPCAGLHVQRGAKFYVQRLKTGERHKRKPHPCLLYTSPSPRDGLLSR